MTLPGLRSAVTGNYGHRKKTRPMYADTSDNVTIIVGNDFFRFDGNDSLVIIKMGDRGLNIQDSPDGKKVDVEKYETELCDLKNYDEGTGNG